MEISEILKSSLTIGIELHASFLFLIIVLYQNMRGSFKRTGRKISISLSVVYYGSAVMVISDSLWNTLSNLYVVNDVIAYIINIIYFLGSSAAAAFWLIFTANNLDKKTFNSNHTHFIMLIPYLGITILYLLSPWFGFIFSIEDGIYSRGTLFFLDPVIKIGYIGIASILAIIYCFNKRIAYLKKKDLSFALFGLPVLICGILQTVTGVDFNCLGVTAAIILIYILGITNQDSENTDAIYSLANSFEASYIVNMDTGIIRPLHDDLMHDKNIVAMQSLDFTTHFTGVLSKIILKEDEEETLKFFKIENVQKRFEIDNAFNIRYRVKAVNGQTMLRSASFIRATGSEGKREFLLGINSINSNSLLYERNETLAHGNDKLEHINASIVESVAKIVEARDSGSGDHIVRVRKLTEIIAKELMNDYPEYNLDNEKVKLICSASVLHDVGKIVIPDNILLKPAKLTEEEFEIMKTHTAKGCDVLNYFPLGLDDAFLECALSICRWHHEKYDGKGYPDGLIGEDIPIAAQIVSAADCFDALVSDRPYKKAFAPNVALDMIKNGECGKFSPKIINVLDKQRNKLIEFARLYKKK